MSVQPFSPLSGLPEEPKNYPTASVELTVDHDETRVSLAQDNNATKQAREHSQKNWEMMLLA